jgi:hypothetical protein
VEITKHLGGLSAWTDPSAQQRCLALLLPWERNTRSALLCHESVSEAIRKVIQGNHATFLAFFGYLNSACSFSLFGLRLRIICWMALIFTQVSLEEMLYS